MATPDSVAAVVAGGEDSAMNYQQGYDDASSTFDRAGMYVDGHWVSNIYPYDAQGRPLVGVQLFDQTGQPLAVKRRRSASTTRLEQPVDKGRVYYPW